MHFFAEFFHISQKNAKGGCSRANVINTTLNLGSMFGNGNVFCKEMNHHKKAADVKTTPAAET